MAFEIDAGYSCWAAGRFEIERQLMRLAYILTQYPKVSHTFIRREIQGIEKYGHEIARFSTSRSRADLVDDDDLEEARKTTDFNAMGISRIIVNVLTFVARRPIRFAKAVVSCLRLGFRNEVPLGREMYYLLQASCFSTILYRASIQHIHAHFGTGGSAVARWCSRLTGIPFSFTIHAHDMFDAPKSRDVFGKVKDARFVVGVCHYTVSQLYRWSDPEDWAKVHSVRCFPGKEFLTNAEEMTPECTGFICVARLDPEKGHLILLQAMQQLSASGMQAHVTLVGDGRFRPDIEKYIRDHGIESLVEMTGNLDARNVRRTIAASRAMILPSFMEGLPIVIMEAFAQRRPVISTYIAGIPELVRPGQNGWLVPASDVDSLAEAMREVLRTPLEQLKKMADAGRLAVENYHDENTELARLESLFRQD